MATMVFPSRKVIVTFRSSVPLMTVASQFAIVPLKVSEVWTWSALGSISAAAEEQRVAPTAKAMTSTNVNTLFFK